MNLFITGTDTGVGKTYVTARIVEALRARGESVAPMKPICAGDRDDAEQLFAAAGGVVPINQINPVWYRTPAAPYAAAMVENRPVDLALIHETFARLRTHYRHVIVEGAGGWLVPVERGMTMADLAVAFGLPVALVVRNRLGALNHTLLSVEAIRRSGLPFAGWIFNDIDAPEDVAGATNAALLEELLGQPPLFFLRAGEEALTLPASW